jgi:hypothetical protein
LIPHLRYKQKSVQDALTAEKLGSEWASDWYALHRQVDSELRREGMRAPSKAQWGNVRGLAAECFHKPKTALLARLGEYCAGERDQRALRNAAWVYETGSRGRSRSLYMAIRANLESIENTEPALAARVLFQAAAEMQKRLARERFR